MVLISNWTHR